MVTLGRGLLLALVVLLACGCTGEPDPAPPTRPPAPTRAAEATGSADVTAADRRYLERGIDGVTSVLATGRPLHFGFGAGPEGSPYLEGAGAYEVDPGRWSASARFEPRAFGQQGAAFTMNVRSHGRDLWMQMESWPEPQRGCWLQLVRGQVPVGLLAMRAGEPVYVSVLSGLAAGPRDGQTMAGSLGLQYALRMLSVQLVQRLDLTAVGQGHVVPVDLTFADGRLASVLVRGEAVRETLLAAGVTMPSTDDEPLEMVLDLMDVRIEYDRTGGAVAAYTPPAGTVFHARQEGCRAG